jgi:hypothetical protein
MQSRKNEPGFAGMLVLVVLVLPIAAWQGFVLMRLWTWFVTPLGVAHVALWQAAGLLVVARVLTITRTPEATRTWGKLAESVSFSVVYAGLSLLLGAIYHGFAG